jgi:type II secretory pathway pseudopilin PulG
MTSVEPKPAAPPSPRNPFQFGLRTLLLLFVVAASSLAVFGAWGILVFVLVVGLAVYLREAESMPRSTELLVVLLLVLGLIALLLPAVQTARESGRQAQCLNNLKQIAVALIYYAERNGSLPPAYTVDKNGKPMHSWRTQALPELEHKDIYTACDFTKPWDAPKNKAILGKPVRIFICPSDPPRSSKLNQTDYFAVVGPKTAWAGAKPRRFADLGKDAAHTVLLVEMANSGIAWAEPKDISLDELRTTSGNASALRLTSNHRPPESFFYSYNGISGVNVALADGSVSWLRTDNLSPERLRQILEIGGFTEDVIANQTGLSAGEHLNLSNIAALAVWLVSVVALLTAAVRGRKARLTPQQRETRNTSPNPEQAQSV